MEENQPTPRRNSSRARSPRAAFSTPDENAPPTTPGERAAKPAPRVTFQPPSASPDDHGPAANRARNDQSTAANQTRDDQGPNTSPARGDQGSSGRPVQGDTGSSVNSAQDDQGSASTRAQAAQDDRGARPAKKAAAGARAPRKTAATGARPAKKAAASRKAAPRRSTDTPATATPAAGASTTPSTAAEAAPPTATEAAPPTATEAVPPTTAEASPPANGRTEAWAKILADPGHAPELLAVAAVQAIGPRARDWAQRTRAAYPAAGPDALARLAAAQFTRLGSVTSVFGAVAGSRTPAALLAANALTHAELALHVAAAYGLDPTDPARAADLLVLTEVHADREAAERALAAARRPAQVRTAGRVGEDHSPALWRAGRMAGLQAGAWALLRAANRYLPGTSLLAATLTGRSSALNMASRATLFYRATFTANSAR
ncbi:hypothetical protein [Krasilnikovia sp. MM14-A1259]|uniref:hypothetical protein n=1 Tax=Krasilnikovia sp. MM14-A1259 TaxID=3373539 RepID=UPI00399D4EE4